MSASEDMDDSLTMLVDLSIALCPCETSPTQFAAISNFVAWSCPSRRSTDGRLERGKSLSLEVTTRILGARARP